MKINLFLLPFLAVLPLAAQDAEVGLFVGQQAYASATVSGSGGASSAIDTSNKTVFALRGGYSVADLGPGSLQVTSAFQPKASATTTVKTTGPNPTTSTLSYRSQYFALGAMYNFKTKVAFGGGLEARFEKLEGDNNRGTSNSVNWVRPWMRLNAGYTFPVGGVKPFVGLDLAVALASKSSALLSDANGLVKVMAPTAQIGIYTGVRF